MRSLAPVLILLAACAAPRAPAHAPANEPADAEEPVNAGSSEPTAAQHVESERAAPPRWAGEFKRAAALHSETLTATPDAAVLTRETNCTSTSVCNGTIRASGERWIEVEFARPLPSFLFAGVLLPVAFASVRLHVVPWEGRDFLVPEHRMLEFCDAFNVYSTAREVRGNLRFMSRATGDEVEYAARGLAELPDVAPEFRAFVLDHEVYGRVIHVAAPVHSTSDVDGESLFETIVTVELESEDQLRVGSQLTFTDPYLAIQLHAGTVVERNGRSYRVALRSYETTAVLEIGARMTTGFDVRARRGRDAARSTANVGERSLGTRAVEGRDEAVARRTRVIAELGAANMPAWAGEFATDRGSIIFTAAPNAGFVARRAGSTPHTDQWNDGAIVASGERWFDVDLALPHEALSFFAERKREACTAKRFHVVTRGERDFLVPEHQLVRFCNTFNSLAHESRLANLLEARFASRANGWSTVPDARTSPEVPAEFAAFVLDHVVRGRLTVVDSPVQSGRYGDGEPRLEVTVTADVGRREGLQVGMWLFREGASPFGSGEIVELEDSTCRAVFRVIDPAAHEPKPFAIGDRVTTCVDAPDPETLDARAKGEREAGRERKREIVEELKRTATAQLPRWAGEYTVSRGGIYCAAAPEAGFVGTRNSHVHGSDGWNHGTISEVTDRSFVVELALPHEALTLYAHGASQPLTAARFHCITHDGRDFLVPENRMIAFCNAINARVVWITTSFPSKPSEAAEDPSRDASVPGVPEEFRRYLLAAPIKCRVTSVSAPARIGEYVGGEPQFETTIEADAGRAEGLLAGHDLFATAVRGLGEGEVVRLGEHTCRVVFRHGAGAQRELLAPGAELTTLWPGMKR